MKQLLAFALILLASCQSATDPAIPLGTGSYKFQHRYAEHPTMPSFQLEARISGKHIVLTIPEAAGPFPAGVLAEGELMWHPASKRWIIGEKPSDRSLQEVGGCSDGPEVVDLVRKIYWTC